jgi:murein DD-endopeptidase MepM/ murein hydrolase activator NlpD
MDAPDGTGAGGPAWLLSLLRLLGPLCLLCLLPPVYGVVAVLPAPVAAADRATWQLPLDGRPRVVAPFAAPGGPYAAGHRGVDLAAAPAARVLAAGAGVVAFAGRVAGRGVVSVDHPGRLRTTYEPVAAVVHAGDPVVAGAVLGLLTGAGGHCPPAACLHWGVRRGADYLDPMTLLGPLRVRLLPVWSATAPDPADPLPQPPMPGDASPAAPRRTSAAPAGRTTPLPPAPGPALLAGLAGMAVAVGAAAAGSLRRRAPP